MVRSKDEILEALKLRLGENPDDDSISFLEDITDTITSYEEKLSGSEDWKTKYEENDKEWRTKYRERIFSGTPTDPIDEPEDKPKKFTFDELFKEDYYQKINDRPLVYYFAWNHTVEKIKEDIAFYKEACLKENIAAPFFVVCGIGPDKIKNIGGDAISRYSIGASKKTFREFLDNNVYTIWERHGKEGEEIGIDNVLPLSAGWHPHPRFETPVNWMNVEENDYVEYASCEEIKEEYEKAKAYLSNEDNFNKTLSNTCIIYAWNEHDEGGWICPTLKVDENGNQLYDENGNKLIDTSRLDAIKSVIK